MTILLRFYILLGAWLWVFVANAQSVYPKNYFRNPLGIPIQLAANFGEVRATHFHSGLDIRTHQQENLPVFAAAQGYVCRVVIDRFGYGRAIYLKHSNGYTTVYGHLNNFYPALDSFVKAKQYTDELWQQDFELESNQFAVNKGQLIAYSGNTGSSEGPHLHFEIRKYDSLGRFDYLNPMLFGLQVPDNIAPTIFKLYYYDRHRSVYLQEAKPIAIVKQKTHYTSADTVVEVSSNKISFGIRAEDRSNATSFYYGVNKLQLYFDDILQYSWDFDKIPMDYTYKVEACIDAPARFEKGLLIQDIASFPSYLQNKNGVITLNDSTTHSIAIHATDEAGNETGLCFNIKYKGADSLAAVTNNANLLLTKDGYTYADSTLFTAILPAYPYKDSIPLLFNKLNFEGANAVSAIYKIAEPKFPAQTSFTVEMQLATPLADSLKDKVVAVLSTGKANFVTKGGWADEGKTVKVARFSKFGEVGLMLDTIAPIIKTIGWDTGHTFRNEKEIRFRITDNVSRVQTFRATLNNQWLMFAEKNNDFFYTFDERCPLGEYVLEVQASDEAGNIAKATYQFTKAAPKPEVKKKATKKKTTKKKKK